MPDKKIQKLYICTKCDAQFSKWNGRCLECGGWGTVQEASGPKSKTKDSGVGIDASEIINLASVKDEKTERIITGIGELDRVFGGGLVPGSLMLLAGEPGIGKSTMLAQMTNVVSKKFAEKSRKQDEIQVLYISGEESAPQVRDRFKRLACDLENIYFASETSLEKIRSSALSIKPKLLIIDSIQTIRSSEMPGEAGSVNQIRVSTASFLEIAKKHNITIIITGHITKDGQVAGPKSLEHIVDTVVYLEHDQSMQYRLLRSSKNRFGSVNEIGVFEMTSKGFAEVKDPSSAFLNSSNQSIAGSTVSCLLEGTRLFLVEAQALVTKTVFGYPQRKATGFDVNRLQILAAVLQKRAGVNLSTQDIILNIVGGLKIKETAMDLAVCAAIISSITDTSLDKQTLFLGEVGLGGEIRTVGKIKDRVREAKRLGFKTVYLPNVEISDKDLKIVKLKTVADLSKLMM